ncbi:MAG: orotate phosphoribosyltransferase [bacterium]|nr:orotate phosphoribosyltransferase [bacterium]
MDSEKLIKKLLETGALLEGHFELTSGLHSNKYFQCALLLQNPEISTELGQKIKDMFSGEKVELVAGPAVGGIIIAHEVARAFGVKSVFAERVDGKMALRRGFGVQKGQKVLLVEDVITTGGSILELVAIFKDAGADVVGIASIVDRSGGKIVFPVPFRPLLSIEVESYQARECPFCAKGAKAEKPGSRNLNRK